MKTEKRCAVCGDTCQTNVIFAWRRDRDGKIFNVCALCAESGAVNENSVENYKTAGTVNTDIENPTPKPTRRTGVAHIVTR